VELKPFQVLLFQKYFEELVDWNCRFNLTAITACEEVQVKHFLDSLTVSLALPRPIPEGFRVIDVGSGAGFPGIPLKIAFPQIELVLLESTGKKADFLKHLVEALSLEKIRVITGRAEEFAQSPVFRETFDASVARALAYMAVLAELTLPFCRIGGRLVAQKKGDLGEEIALSASAIAILGGGPPVIRQVILPGLIDNRCLVVVDKISATPPQYPRHVGIPAKRPLSPH
jgi:16S rRNA (guanine527-N7)-methyltransferase